MMMMMVIIIVIVVIFITNTLWLLYLHFLGLLYKMAGPFFLFDARSLACFHVGLQTFLAQSDFIVGIAGCPRAQVRHWYHDLLIVKSTGHALISWPSHRRPTEMSQQCREDPWNVLKCHDTPHWKPTFSLGGLWYDSCHDTSILDQWPVEATARSAPRGRRTDSAFDFNL